MSLKSRLRCLEAFARKAACPGCRISPPTLNVYYPEEGQPAPQPKLCPACRRQTGVVLRVVYEGGGET